MKTALSQKLVSDPIVHRMVQYQQQDYKGRIFNVVRVITASGRTSILLEEVEASQEIEQPLKVRLAHMWNIWNDSIQVIPCGQAETCKVCIAHTERKAVAHPALTA